VGHLDLPPTAMAEPIVAAAIVTGLGPVTATGDRQLMMPGNGRGIEQRAEPET
jgi:hypothetical protein